MFGVVPKVLWERHKPADAQNRIQMTTNCLLIGSPNGETLLVDAGIGEKLDARGRAQFALPPGEPRLLDRLRGGRRRPRERRPCGAQPPALRPLRLEHAPRPGRGGESGGCPPSPTPATGSSATSWRTRAGPTTATGRATTRATSSRWWRRGCVELFDEEAEPVPGVRQWRAPGHTRGCRWSPSRTPARAHLPGRPRAHRGAPAHALGDGLRPLPGHHDGDQAGLGGARRRGRLAVRLRARPRDPGGAAEPGDRPGGGARWRSRSERSEHEPAGAPRRAVARTQARLGAPLPEIQGSRDGN